ncbi:hypothetical protein RclHR1_12250001 [Rhizophagus clarus]|uniref:Uncharacterized protein n=1 Tax=Rhizophagus clarus TaxID=94130 RepID=A0A2Z6Q894_9GLOM|nr:hypothetical protein RclHR1_12250001 [Rhizophagus clarus]
MDLGCSGLKLEDYYYDFDESDSELGDNSGLKLEDYYFDIGDLELGEYYYNTNDISDLELGDYYHNEKKDYKKAIAIYRKCAYEGNIHGINRIAEYYILRRGVDENDDENDDKAFEWYEYSAGKNDVIGALYMGYCYKYKIGVAVNNMEKNERKRKEIEWFQKAADLGSPEGAFQIGLHYESLAWSQNNAEENGKKAMKYFARSANLGFACGYFKLYKFYKDKNIDKANHFYNNYCLEVCKAKHLDDVIEVHSSALYIKFIVSKELSYLLLPFLFSYGLLSYGRHSLGVTDLKILLNQHHIYLALLCITIFFSQLINFICCTLPVTIIIILKPIFSFDIFKELANYPGIFKHFIMIFLSRGLSIGELKMIEKYLNIYSSDKLYFWFDQNREKRTKEYSHVSFEKDSFEYLEKLRKDEIKEYKIKQKIKDNEKKIEQKEEWENEINWENEIRKKF